MIKKHTCLSALRASTMRRWAEAEEASTGGIGKLVAAGDKLVMTDVGAAAPPAGGLTKSRATL